MLLTITTCILSTIMMLHIFSKAKRSASCILELKVLISTVVNTGEGRREIHSVKKSVKLQFIES